MKKKNTEIKNEAIYHNRKNNDIKDNILSYVKPL